MNPVTSPLAPTQANVARRGTSNARENADDAFATALAAALAPAQPQPVSTTRQKNDEGRSVEEARSMEGRGAKPRESSSAGTRERESAAVKGTDRTTERETPAHKRPEQLSAHDAEAVNADATASPSAPASEGLVSQLSQSAAVGTVNRSAENLDATLRQRLDRVIQRMDTEFGHTVKLVEGVRTQARQDALFAQGRTTDGPVVTWTRDSAHLHGLAADVIVDGTYENPVAYARLQRIANEEGLRTLGMKDPGHLELPRGGSIVSASAAVPETAAASGAVARVARVAEVATLARVAAVADPHATVRLAEPARVSTSETSTARGAGGVATQVVTSLTARRDAGTRGGQGGESDSQRQGLQQMHELARGDWQSALQAVRPELLGAEAPTAIDRTSAAASVSRVLDLQDASANRPVSHMLLRLENGMGGEDQIRVDVRGGSVGASISMGDAGSAERLGARIGELQAALERRGLEPEMIQVRTTPRLAEPDAARLAVTARESQRVLDTAGTDAGNTTGRERHGRGQEEPREQQQDPRQRARREQQGDRNP